MAEIMPPASLDPRDTDVALLPEQIRSIPFFAQLKKSPDPKRFPGTLILRFFRKGEIICRQGESGWSAFSILSDRDALEVLRKYLAQGVRDHERPRIEREVARLQAEASKPEQDAALVYLALPRPHEAKQSGWLGRLTDKVLGRKKPAARERPLYIPIDAPTDIPYETKQATLRDGDLFGEMSSLYGTPRSATVVATRDLYVLEMLRNILDEVKRDPAFQKRVDDIYRERVLATHLSALPLFRDLNAQQQALLREKAELLRFKDGDIICDEDDRSDSLYIIRRGMVRVLKNASALLSVGDVADWPRLTTLLREASGEGTTGPRAALWKLLPDDPRQLAGRDSSLLTAEEQQAFVYGLNELVKNRELPDHKELQAAITSPKLSALRATLPKKTADWPEAELRRFNRQLLEEIFPETLVALRRSKGPLTTLAFRGRGEFIGEMGLLLKQPRMASCIAYVHPLPEGPGAAPLWLRQGDLVEIVRITEATFWELVQGSEQMLAEVKERTAARQRETVKQMEERHWDDPLQTLTSERFGKMGLVQGQRLMLVDLNSCTRCDECVKACVDTHDDGYSRLFLDGDRFGKYLVPSSCRACLEPVCMIGCPVGSIHRGGNTQIVIEDWCIGCGLCARNCPYGSIQMHDIGIVANEAHGWKFIPADAVTGRPWYEPAFRDGNWLIGKAPFYNDPDLAARLGELPTSLATTSPTSGLCFRHEFSMNQQTVTSAKEFALELTATDETASVWINGKEITTKERAKRGVRLFSFTREAADLRAGTNLVAVLVKLVPGKEGTVFDLRIDEVRTPNLPQGIIGEFTEKNYGRLAVVCDLCSSQYGQRPACVTACPHDAAMRIDARFQFPQQ
jgi:CRP-like cAMP-binding protein/Fe-S-cluster-containing hydrogenase component 2